MAPPGTTTGNVLVFCLLFSVIHTRETLVVERLHITSDVTFRFASTNVTSELVNTADEAQEVTFKVTLPLAAFISSFSMFIDGQLYEGVVKDKAEAQRQYDKAKERGQSAGQVAAKSIKEANKFKININVAASAHVRFELLYDELLQRRLGMYEHVINIDPGQPVKDMKIKVNIVESRPITFLMVPDIRPINENVIIQDENPHAVITRPRDHEAIVSFRPSRNEQRQYSVDGISGQFVVYYDIERELDGGEIQVVDGYFVHYLAPGGLEPVDKNIVFVIDTSGSMSGSKMEQTKQAMRTILRDLRPGDQFNIITFAGHAQQWKARMVRADEEQVRNAKKFVGDLLAQGGTNMNEGVLEGIAQTRAQAALDSEPRPALIICLTDGRPTDGMTGMSEITRNVKQANMHGHSIFMLGLGEDVDFPFLRRIALQNGGLARRIYTDADTALQLDTFYQEVSTPIMSNVKVRYLDDSVEVDSVTTTDFDNLFNGTEIIIAGKLAHNVNNVISQVSGHASSGYMEMMLRANVARIENRLRNLNLAHLTERLWAYLTIQKLLQTMQASTDDNVLENAKSRALQLSLQYQFVTPLTSMVVTLPEEETPEVNVQPNEATTARPGTQSHPAVPPQYMPLEPPRRQSPRQSFVDNDPHFVLNIEGISDKVCFDLNGQPGEVYQLLRDNENDITVNAEIDAPDVMSKDAKHIPTFISKLSIMHAALTLIVRPKSITVQHERIAWKKGFTMMFGDLTISFIKDNNMQITIGDGIELMILRHLSRTPSPQKINFLGFYIETGRGLSTDCLGLIGQFQNINAHFLHKIPSTEMTQKRRERILAITSKPHENHSIADATITRTVHVYKGQRRNMKLKEHIPCWHARNNGRDLIKGKPEDYLVLNLHQKLSLVEQVSSEFMS